MRSLKVKNLKLVMNVAPLLIHWYEKFHHILLILFKEIDGCLFNNTCWVNPITQTTDCQDVPASQLRPYNTGYEIVCGACPHGMTGTGDIADGQDGCRGEY